MEGLSSISDGGSLTSAGFKKSAGQSVLAGGGSPASTGTIKRVATARNISGGGQVVSVVRKGSLSSAAISGGGGVLASSGKHVVVGAVITGGGDQTSVSGKLIRGISRLIGGGAIVAEGYRVGYTLVFPVPVSIYTTVTEVRLRIVARTLSKDSDTFTVVLVRRATGAVLDTVVVPINAWERRSIEAVSVTRADLLDGVNAQIEVPQGSTVRLNQMIFDVVGSNP